MSLRIAVSGNIHVTSHCWNAAAVLPGIAIFSAGTAGIGARHA
jgi:hypothetical protein